MNDKIVIEAKEEHTDEPFILCFCGNNVNVPEYERIMQDITYDLYKWEEINEDN